MSDSEFGRLSALVYDSCGITLPPAKKAMLTSRLLKRLRCLGISSFADYLALVTSPEGKSRELVGMLNVVSTNKTEFFREAEHFKFLFSQVLPAYAAMNHGTGHVSLWSAGCSSGEEAYTLAMLLTEFGARHSRLDFTILATDISTRVLDAAETAVYPEEGLGSVPQALRRRYFLRGKGDKKGLFRVVPELRRRVTFRRLNFMDRDFGIAEKMDVIFCRNVLIYFDQKTRIELFEKFYSNLAPGGYIFIGHSEILEGINDRMERLAPAVYKCR